MRSCWIRRLVFSLVVLGVGLVWGWTPGLSGPKAAEAVPIFATLSTAAGDGQVVVDVGAYGDFGYETFDESGGQGDPGDAMYDPVGHTGLRTTTWEPALPLRRPDIFIGCVP